MMSDDSFDDGFIGPKQFKEAEDLARNLGITVDEALLLLGYVHAADLAQLQAKQYGYEVVDLSTIKIPQIVITLIPEWFGRKYIVIPVSLLHGRLRVAMVNANDLDLIDKLRSIASCDIDPIMALKESILTAINRNYRGTDV